MSARRLTALELLAAIRDSEPSVKRQIASEWLAAFMFLVAVLLWTFILATMQ